MKYAILRGSVVHRVDNTESPISIICPDNVEVGWVYKEGVFNAPPGTLSYAKTRKMAEINNRRSKELDDNVTYGGYQFRTDPVSILNLLQILSAVNSGYVLPANFTWRSVNNENIPATAAQLQQLNILIETKTYTIYKHSWDLKDQVAAATTVAEVSNIQW